jgi:hypothetical protein
MSFPSAFLPSPPDLASRQPFTTAAFLPLYSLYYVLAVLAILPHTHSKACPLARPSVAGLEMCSEARPLRRAGKLIGY